MSSSSKKPIVKLDKGPSLGDDSKFLHNHLGPNSALEQALKRKEQHQQAQYNPISDPTTKKGGSKAKIHVGPRGGRYVLVHGKKVYV